jgi:hypothetical protein
MKLQEIAAKVFWFLPFGKPAERSGAPSIDQPERSAATSAINPPAPRKNIIGDGYLPVADKLIEQTFTADFRSASVEGDLIRLSALKSLQRVVLSKADNHADRSKLSPQQFTQVVQECIQLSKEVAGIFRDTGDEDLALNEEKEIEVLEAYLTPRTPELPPELEKPREPVLPPSSPKTQAVTAPHKAKTLSLSCAKCQTSAKNWLLRHDAAGRPFPTSPNYRSNSGRMLVFCPDCLIAALAADRFERESPTQPQRQTPLPPAVKRSGYDGRYAPNIQKGFKWKGTGFCQHCNRRSMPGGDVCYSCNPD